ncbi:auxin-responsive protein SAUR36-like [Syzygium oleosum]|uniref:auxin-responsive protein SAUR36-like n=1 Tax=Syzygium oleosum TaxID=219896 RepID=UPI0024B9E9D9|nr:auxin-responsive protein SAUR36-like [Syzygium oleosum]
MVTGDDKTTRGFGLKKHLFRVSRWVAGRARGPSREYCRLGLSPSGPCATDSVSELLSWCCRLTSRRAGFSRSGRPIEAGDMPVGQDLVEEGPPAAVPKGHLAVYVGRRSGEFRRVLVPVVDFNHPMFGNLLREAGEEFGFSHRGGGITIPCEVSEFERVKSRVAAAGYGGRRSARKKKHL